MTRSPGEVPETFLSNISSRTRAAKERSQRQTRRVQNAAFLLGIRPELPDANDLDSEMLNRGMRVVERFYGDMADSQLIGGFSAQQEQPEFQEPEKGNLKPSLHLGP